MFFATYPIEGANRFPQLMMEFIFTLACLEFCMIFCIRYLKQDKELRNLQDFGYATLMLGLGLMVFWFLIGDYFAPNYSVQ